jgi:hypothetical protein
VNIWKPTSIVAKILLSTILLLPIVLQPQVSVLHAQVAQSAQALDTAPADLRDYVADVIKQLASSETLSTWKDADSVIEPLGPGTHSWLVTIKTKQAPPGYLIISSTESGEYKLVEYGSGPDSLYVQSTLESALKGSGLSKQGVLTENAVPLYGGPVLAEWEVAKPNSKNSTHFLNALTGELLPESKNSWAQQVAAYRAPELAVGSAQKELSPERTVHTSKVFDPYDNILWMTEKALQVKQESFETLLNVSKRLVFISSGPKRTYSMSLPIHGYQKWSGSDSSIYSNESIYVLTGTDSSSRWISLHALLECGYFVTYKG